MMTPGAYLYIQGKHQKNGASGEVMCLEQKRGQAAAPCLIFEQAQNYYQIDSNKCFTRAR